MSRKMVINRLDKDELAYELAVRGIAPGSCEEMRRRFSQALQLEKDGSSLKYPPYPFTCEQDFEAVQKKLCELEEMVTKFSGGKGSSETQKLETKFNHVLGRLDNMVPDGEANQQKKSELIATALSIMESLHEKVEDFEKEKPHIPPPSLSFMEVQVGHETFQQNLAHTARSSPIGTGGVAQLTASGREDKTMKTIPPHKWNIQKFSGDKKGSVSINAFLERVEELRVARNVSEETLFSSGIDLFTDKAYQFYKECRARVSNWKEMSQEFRAEYLSSTYEEELFEELQRRTQHSTESVGVYLAIMSSYFNRLRCPISEEAKLKIIMKNLHPFYLERLRDPLPTSMSELRTVCRSMEARRDMIDKYVEPSSRRGAALEKDLAYVETSMDVKVVAPKSTSQMDRNATGKAITCFRCNQPGHKAMGCALPKKLVCYRCKAEGYTVRTCPTCRPSGNASRRS